LEVREIVVHNKDEAPMLVTGGMWTNSMVVEDNVMPLTEMLVEKDGSEFH
jgi:hypothetical protein